jgi:hypothetical protein
VEDEDEANKDAEGGMAIGGLLGGGLVPSGFKPLEQHRRKIV